MLFTLSTESILQNVSRNSQDGAGLFQEIYSHALGQSVREHLPPISLKTSFSTTEALQRVSNELLAPRSFSVADYLAALIPVALVMDQKIPQAQVKSVIADKIQSFSENPAAKRTLTAWAILIGLVNQGTEDSTTLYVTLSEYLSFATGISGELLPSEVNDSLLSIGSQLGAATPLSNDHFSTFQSIQTVCRDTLSILKEHMSELDQLIENQSLWLLNSDCSPFQLKEDAAVLERHLRKLTPEKPYSAALGAMRGSFIDFPTALGRYCDALESYTIGAMDVHIEARKNASLFSPRGAELELFLNQSVNGELHRATAFRAAVSSRPWNTIGPSDEVLIESDSRFTDFQLQLANEFIGQIRSYAEKSSRALSSEFATELEHAAIHREYP